MFIDFLIKKHECNHIHVPIDVDEAYCPDCGALVKNQWFLVRCACCNIKRKAHFEYNSIKTDTKYCHNCGSTEFYVEELENINCVTMNYAIHKKIIINQETYSTRQIWIEKEDEKIEEKKLISMKK